VSRPRESLLVGEAGGIGDDVEHRLHGGVLVSAGLAVGGLVEQTGEVLDGSQVMGEGP
jgi:hypothetical protein